MSSPDQLSHKSKPILNGRYILNEKIGQGGMGVVYKTKDRLNNKTVALKHVKPNSEIDELGSESTIGTQKEFRLVLAKEFQILAGLRHPNIISVLDYGFDEKKQPFYTMEYLRETQTIVAAAEDLPFEDKLNLIQQLLQGLRYLHRRGVLHRDIKPANVLVSNGVVYLLDFGLSHSIEDEGYMGGSPVYMAPELIDGELATVQSDLYSVGVILYKLLTGNHPYGTFDTGFYQRMYTTEPNMSHIDKRVQSLLKSLLGKQSSERPSSVADVLNQIAISLNQAFPLETEAIRESYLQAAQFVGRKQELNLLSQALTETIKGASSVWLIGGESGVGKSRLIEEFRSRALVNGFRVLVGQGVEDGGLPYQVWRTIAPQLILGIDLTDFEASVLSEIVPNIKELLKRDVLAPPKLAGSAAKQRLAHTLIDILKRQSNPTLLLLEDLQWTDESLIPIQHILEHLDQLPNLLLVASYRHDERPDLPNQLSGSKSIKLERLEDNAVALLSQSILGKHKNQTELVRLLQSETEGNTFFIVEAIRALASEAGQLAAIGSMDLPAKILTNGMSHLLDRRLQQVHQNDRKLLALAAVAGRELDAILLKQLAPDVSVEDWMLRTSDVSVLEVHNNQFRFSHDKLREAILTRLTAEELKKYHRAVADALEIIYPNEPEYNSILLTHWQAAEDPEKEQIYLLPVAEKLIRLTANHDQGRSLLNRALELAPEKNAHRAKLLIRLAESYFRQGRFDEGEKFALESLAVAQEAGYQQGIGDGFNHLGIVAESRRDLKASQHYFEQSFKIFEEAQDPSGIASSLNHLGIIAWNNGDYEGATGFYKKSLTAFKKIYDHQATASILLNLGTVASSQNNFDLALDYLNQSLEISQSTGDRQGIASNLNQLGVVTINLGSLTTAQKHLEQCLTLCMEIGNRRIMGFALLNLGEIAWVRGQYEGARQYYNRYLELSEDGGIQRGVASSLRLLGYVDYLQGHYESAHCFYKRAIEIYQELDDKNYFATCLFCYGDLARNQGDYNAALDYYTQSKAIWEEIDHKSNLPRADMGFGALYLAQGQPEIGLTYLQKAFQAALDENITTEFGGIYGFLALCQFATNRYDAALDTALDYFRKHSDIESDRSEGSVHLAVAQTLAALKNEKHQSQSPLLKKLTKRTKIESSPEAYFETALESAHAFDKRLKILMSYGRYLVQSNQTEKAFDYLNKAQEMAKANNLLMYLSQIDALLCLQ